MHKTVFGTATGSTTPRPTPKGSQQVSPSPGDGSYVDHLLPDQWKSIGEVIMPNLIRQGIPVPEVQAPVATVTVQPVEVKTLPQRTEKTPFTPATTMPNVGQQTRPTPKLLASSSSYHIPR